MKNTKYIELSYCDMPYMLKNQKCIKRKNQNIYPFPSYRLQVYYEEKNKRDISIKFKRYRKETKAIRNNKSIY